MNYWHLQMMDGLQSEELLTTEEVRDVIVEKNIIGTGEWRDNKNDQCKNFKEAIAVGDIVLVRNGASPIALVEVTEKNIPCTVYQNEHRVKLLSLYDESAKIKAGEYDGQTQGTLTRVVNRQSDTAQFIINWHSSIIKESKMKSTIDLLKYKKQIILQGPPGTGKTREAKLIAQNLIGTVDLQDDLITSTLSIGVNLFTPTNYNTFTISEISSKYRYVKVQPKGASNDYTVPFDKIIPCYQAKGWNDKLEKWDTNGIVSYLIPVCKYLYDKINDLSKSEYFKIVQFHPSYGYEDFVRGIVALPNPDGEGVIYEAIDKHLAIFAKSALENWKNSQKSSSVFSREKWVTEQFNLFVETLKEELAEKGRINLTDSVSIVSIEPTAFRYKGSGAWSTKGNRMIFKDIIQGYLDGNEERQDMRYNTNLSGLANWHASYYIRVLDMFKIFLEEKKLQFKEQKENSVAVKDFVLVIDEINRANLSSVLGELIYALEYRGESLDSIYDVDGTEIVLPPNLYILGTMNTADRSVGHIDYAIRRRFAFVDILPKDLSGEPNIKFDAALFKEVKELFTKDDYKTRSAYLSMEFEPSAVALGHSYFIDKSADGGSMAVRLEYEIKPILREYVRDGVLIGEAIPDLIENLKATI